MCEQRAKRQNLLKTVDCVEIHNNPYLGYQYDVSIGRTGIVHYQNNTDCKYDIVLHMDQADAEYLMDSLMEELFCNDFGSHGVPMIDGHWWELIFRRKNEIVHATEGWSNEDPWRYNQISKIIKFAEGILPVELGAKYMGFDGCEVE